MNNKNTKMIALGVAVLLCGCPGLLALCWGSLAAVISFMPGADINIGGSTDPGAALSSGLGSVCLGILFLAVPVAVGFFALRKQPGAVNDTPNDIQPPA